MFFNHKIAFAASLFLGLSATYFLAEVLERRSAGAVTNVVVGREFIPKGTSLRASQLETVDWPSRSAPAGAFHSSNALLGRILRENLVEGEPVLPGKLWPEGSKGNLIDTIEVGQRAMTVRIQEVSGIQAEELIGASVDVMLSSRDAQNQPFSRVILENVQVLAVPGHPAKSTGRTGGINTVTLQLSPEDAQRLDLARSIGTLSLSLRHHGDIFENNLPGVPRTQLIQTAPKIQHSGPQSSVAPRLSDSVRPAPVQKEIEVIRGTVLQKTP